MRTSFRLTALLLALPAALVPAARAQTEALPDLTPREFEIRGDLQVDFSNIQRQPLSGFGPPPRAYVIPAERTPTERPYAYPVEQITPPELDAQPVPKPDLLRPLAGSAEGLVGAYAARAARLHLHQHRARGAFFLDLDYDGASTYTPFDASVSDGAGIYNRAAGHAGYRSYGGVTVEAGGRFVDHELYGASFRAFSERGGAFPDQPTRTAAHGFAALAVGSEARPYEVRARYDYADLATDLDGYAVPFGAATEDPTEGRLTLDGHGDAGRLRVDGHVSAAGTDAALGADVYGFSAGAAYTLRATPTQRLAVGGRVLGSDGALPSNPATVGPVVRFELRARRSPVRVFAYNEPQVVDQGLAELLEANPFVEVLPAVMPEVQVVNARAGLQTQLGALRATVYGGAQWGENARYFERDAQTGLFAVGYGDVRRLFGGVEAAFGPPERLEATVGLEARAGELVDLDADLPYYAPVVARAALTAVLLEKRLRLGLRARVEGVRPVSLDGAEADGFVDLGADGAYALSDRLDVLVRVDRLAGEVERWVNYPEAPLTVLGGVRARW